MTEAAPRPARPRLAALAWAGAFAVLAAVVLGFEAPGGLDPSGELAQDVTARGYNAIVDRIFSARGQGWLRLDDSGDPDAAAVSLSPAARAYPEVNDFYRLSFLKRDLTGGDPAIWKIEDGRVVGVNPEAHAIRLPFARRDVWRGDLDYRDEAQVQVRVSAGGVSYVLDPMVDAAAPAPGLNLFGGDAAPPAGETHAQRVRLLLGAVPVAQIFRVGTSSPVIRLESAAARVIIDGAVMSVAEGQAAYARLDPGAQVLVERVSDGKPAPVAIQAGAGALSHRAPLGQRERDPAIQNVALAVERAMNIAVANRAAEPDVRLVTTLDAQTQASLQAILEAYCEQGRARTPGGPPFRAAITVMDVSSGDILALASYPRTLVEVGSPSSRRASDRRLIETNQNFARLSIGSSAKPIFASAILQRWPGLRTLAIPGGYGPHEMTDLFGVALDPPIDEHGVSDASITFPLFLAKSSNRYAAMLMLLAASPRPFDAGTIPAAEGYDLGGHRAVLPPLAFDNAAPPGQSARLVVRNANFIQGVSDRTARGGAEPYAAWPVWLDRLFDLPGFESVAADEGAADPRLLGGPDYDLGVWAPLAGRFGERGMAGFLDTAATPERERLSMNVINNFRTDYLNLVIGGGRSQWTTVKLAEIYGRIATGRRLRARLVRQIGDAAERPAAADALPWNADVWAAVRDGMSKVSTIGTAASGRMSHATARLAAMAAAKGGALALYSKTGTPTLTTISPSAAGRAVEDLYAAGLLRLADEGRRIGVAAGPGGLAIPVSGSRDPPEAVAAAVQALKRSPRVMAVLAERQVSAEAVATYMARYNNANSPAEKARWLRVVGAAVVAAPRESRNGDGRVYVMALLRNAPGQPPAGVVVAINIQQNWPVRTGAPGEAGLPEHVAAALGVELLEGPLDRPLWLTDVRRVAAPAPAAAQSSRSAAAKPAARPARRR